jgi:serine/threonine-protein phosphatase 2B regulatory subunit
MGADQSRLSKDEIHLVAHFSERDIRRLYGRFRSLDADGNGQLDPSEILGVKEISENPLTKRVTAVFDKNKNGTVSFIEFLVGLARLASTADKEEKLRFAFEVYDVNRDGYISNGDLFSVMQAMVGDNLSDEQLQQLVDREMRDLDKDKDGLISFEEFKEGVKDLDVAEQLTMDVSPT